MGNIPTQRHSLLQSGPPGAPPIPDADWYRYWADCGPVSVAFLPTLSFGGASVGMTYSSQLGRAYLIGPLVFFSLTMLLTNKGVSVGLASFDGLPFANTLEQIGAYATRLNVMTAGVGDTMIMSTIGLGATSLIPAKIGAGTGAYVTLTDADFTNASTIRVAGSYYRAP